MICMVCNTVTEGTVPMACPMVCPYGFPTAIFKRLKYDEDAGRSRGAFDFPPQLLPALSMSPLKRPRACGPWTRGGGRDGFVVTSFEKSEKGLSCRRKISDMAALFSFPV